MVDKHAQQCYEPDRQANAARTEARALREAQDREPVVLKTYTGIRKDITKQFQRDMPRMLAQGYQVESQQLIPGHRGGCLMMLGVVTFGIVALLIRPKDTLMVTYRLAV